MDTQPVSKRRRVERSPSPTYKLDGEDETRRQAKLAKLTSLGANSDKERTKRQQREQQEREDEANEEEARRERLRKERTLLMEAQDVHSQKAAEDAKKTEEEKTREADDKIFNAIKSHKMLASDMELAKGWRPPKYIRERSEEENERIRKKYHILTEGEDIPPPIEHFADMKLPDSIFQYLKSHRIVSPTPIQLQGIPTACLLYEARALSVSFLCPSRELANQTYENVVGWCSAVAKESKYPQLNTLLCIGGISMNEQSHVMSKGLHIVVATPGRLIDMLEKKTYLCMDEADRMIDLGFEDDVRNIMSFFKRQRQTLLFSATMPKKIQDFAQQSLIRPILVNVGRAGAANLDVLQVVEYVKQEAKMVYLLECLQKTPPPVIIFSEIKNEVDDIQEYLLLKGVEAVAIHGSKTQEERQYAIKSFKSGAKDVMVASEIEDYVHQIGRTGRSGKTGIATTFVNMNTPEQTLLDLKYLLMEAGQKVPPFLATIEDPRAAQGGSLKGCPVCGGLGHGISNCPKLEDAQRRQMAAHRPGDDGGGY
ncbi:P-loop containing nucleoside triphosphate hydrolase protein [Armillaria novae-zelandiae]|uniref:RNA helicase n=1 Tax=Armillaria novae-zelandiae TaxID=153914 RepID=A0AA39P5V6_9AGAR|nr:P-loop containing nucleoside triphosphate hydrolase protein [Armillaria novae-zelandiae]